MKHCGFFAAETYTQGGIMPDQQPYFRMGAQDVLTQLDTTIEGLSAKQAVERLEQHGPNQLVEGEKKSTLQVFIDLIEGNEFTMQQKASCDKLILEIQHIITKRDE